jgi:hypothetical protein
MKPRNTTAEMNADPMLALLTMGLPGGIERMEARGQQELVKGESLPTECSDKAALEAAGVVFGAPYPDDPLFCPVTLPEGWKKQATSHAMHSNLLDDKGRVRASIFYKAASYDRRADMYAKRRYNIDAYAPIPGKDRESTQVVVKDGETTIQEFGEAKGYDEREEVRKLAAAWLNENFPQWESCAAYWDQP